MQDLILKELSMATTEPVNTQQILQMGSHTEKLQQTLQQQPVIISQQLEDERINATELKRNEVQGPDNSQLADPSNPDSRARSGRIRIHSKKQASFSESEKEFIPNVNEQQQGNQIDIVA